MGKDGGVKYPILHACGHITMGSESWAKDSRSRGKLCRNSGLPISEVERQCDMGFIEVEETDSASYYPTSVEARNEPMKMGDRIRMGVGLVRTVFVGDEQSKSAAKSGATL